MAADNHSRNPNLESQIPEGFIQTEVGVIPEEWCCTQLDSVSKVIDSLHKTPKFSSSGYAMVRVADIKTGILTLENTLKVSAKVFKEFTKNYKPKRCDIVLSRVGSYGISSYVETCEEFCMGQNTVVIQSKLPSRLLYYALNSVSTWRQIENGSYGSGYKSLSLRNIKELWISLPPTLTEQRAIAEALSDADALIESLKQLITKKRRIKQGAMQELLTGKRRLPGFEGEWEVKYIGDFADCTAGGTPSTKVQEYWDGSIRWMSSGELNLKFVRDVEGRITERGLRESSTKTVPPRCVLIGLAGQGKTRGTVAINSVELCTNQSIAAILPNALFVPEYLYYNLDTRYHELRGLSTGDGGRGGLNLSIIKSIEVPFPPVEEQSAIAIILSDMDAEIEALEERRDKSKDLKQGMMQELLTGRIRLV